MTERIIHGYSEAEIQAHRIPLNAQNECMKYYIPLKKCMVLAGGKQIFSSGYCEEERRDYQICQRPIDMRRTGIGAMVLKKNDPKKFQEERIAPSLTRNFNPTFLDMTRH